MSFDPVEFQHNDRATFEMGLTFFVSPNFHDFFVQKVGDTKISGNKVLAYSIQRKTEWTNNNNVIGNFVC